MAVKPLGGLLFPEHVAQIWTEERRKQNPDAPEVKVATVHDYYRWSKPGHRYENNPVPPAKAARGPRQPAWLAEQEQDLRDWWNNRAGQGWRMGQRRPLTPPWRRPQPTGEQGGP